MLSGGICCLKLRIVTEDYLRGAIKCKISHFVKSITFYEIILICAVRNKRFRRAFCDNAGPEDKKA